MITNRNVLRITILTPEKVRERDGGTLKAKGKIMLVIMTLKQVGAS